MNQELRVIITQSCNYNCYFCHHEGVNKQRKNMMTSEDLTYLYNIADKYLGIKKMTLTGGEPLILDNIIQIVKSLNERGCELTIVTNGSYLNRKLDVCKYIKKLNISIHSLKKEEYEKIVGRKDSYERIMNNIKLVRKEYPNLEINLNYAFIDSKDKYDKILDLIEFSKENKLNIKFIELFPKKCKDYIPIENLQAFLLSNGHIILETNDRKTKFSNIKDSYIYTTKCFCSRSLDFDSPSEFCNKNNDIFITPDGNAKICRLRNNEITLIDDIKNKNEISLSEKLKLSFEKLGEGCPFDKNMII